MQFALSKHFRRGFRNSAKRLLQLQRRARRKFGVIFVVDRKSKNRDDALSVG